MPALKEIPVVPLPYPPREIWRAGTLTYTTAGLCVLFGWLLWGDFAWSMKDRTVGPVLQLLLKKYSASDMLNGALLASLPLVISLVLGPIISYLSDRHRGPWGRRIPFLLIPTPIIALSMIGLAFCPAWGAPLDKLLGAHSPGVNGATLMLLGFFWIVFDFSTTIANSVFGGLINDVVPDEVLGRFYGAFRALSLIAGIGFNFWLFGKAESESFWVFLAMGSLYGIGFSIMCFKVKEGQYPPPPEPDAPWGITAFLSAAKVYFKECYSIPYYWFLYLSGALSWMAFMPFNLFNLFYAKDLQMDMVTYGHCAALTFFISLCLAYPLGMLADRVHPLPLALSVQFIYVATTLASGFLVTDQTTFAIALVIHGVLSGTWMTSNASLGNRLLPKEKFAQFASAGGIIGCLGGILVGPVVGYFLDHTGHHYRYTFFISGGMGGVALAVGLVVYAKFLALGGTRDYVAPQ